MSLLMKALEKAAQQRDQGGKAPAAAPLSLEPMPEARHTAAPSSERVSAAPAPRSVTPSPQLRAAAVLAASARHDSSSPLMAWFTVRPVYAFGALAALFLLCYGAYVYVQIAHPGLLTRSPPRVTAAPQAAAPVPAPSAPAAAAPAPVEREEPDDAPRAAAPTLAAPPASTTPAGDGATARDSGVIARVPPAPPAPLAPPPRATAAPVPLAQQQRIAISRADDAQPRVNATVAQAWTALQAGQLDTARGLYEQVLRSEPAHSDAHLGLAAIAQGDGRFADAQQHYLAILDADPRHALAQSGLIALSSRNDPQAAETRLKQLIAREPSAPLYFNLGNVYAEQGQWRDAQQAYFQAHHLDGRNPDYAYNLAVGLEHLAQPRIALDFYRKALELAAARGSANFDTARAQQRITRLAANP